MIGVSLDVGLLCEPQVTAVGLAFASKRLLEVLMCFGAVQCGHECSPWFGLFVGSAARTPRRTLRGFRPNGLRPCGRLGFFSGEPAMKDDAHSLDFEADGQLRTQRVDVVDVDIEESAGFLAYRVVVFFDG